MWLKNLCYLLSAPVVTCQMLTVVPELASSSHDAACYDPRDDSANRAKDVLIR